MQGNFPANTAKKEFKSWVLNGFSDGERILQSDI